MLSSRTIRLIKCKSRSLSNCSVNGNRIGTLVSFISVSLLSTCVGSVWGINTGGGGDNENGAGGVTTLRTCCEYQSMYSEQKNSCSASDPGLIKIPFGSYFNLPEVLLNPVFGNSTEDIQFRLKREAPSCSKGSFVTTLPIRKKKKSNDLTDSISFTPNGYLQIGLEYYSPQEYCIDRLNEEKLAVAVCHPTCDEKRPCLTKCCDMGEVWDFTELNYGAGVPICKPSGEKQWEPTLYADRNTKMGQKERKSLAPHYSANHPSNGWCELGHPFIISLKNVQEASHGIIFRILSDGSVVTRIRRRQWNYLPQGDFCIDGAMNLNTVGIPFLGGEDDTVILYCHKEVQTSETTMSQVYGISMTISSLFLLMTLIVFAILWERHKHNILRWTVFCYVLTLLFMYFFFIMSYFSPFFDQETLTNGGLCRAIGIGMHFFFLGAFCWLTTLNFEIWWTVRAVHTTVRSIAGFKRLIAYGVFAFGIPTIIVGVGLILALIYDGNMESEVIIPEYGRLTCNIGTREAFYFYMYGPAAVLLLSNLIFFSTTVWQMWRLYKKALAESNPPTKHQKIQIGLVILFAKLYVIMGVPWIFEVISFAAQEDQFKWYWLLFDMINIFQSVAIFIIFVCNRETALDLEQKFPCLKRICCWSHAKRGDPGHRASNLDDSNMSSVEIAPKDAFELNGQQP